MIHVTAVKKLKGSFVLGLSFSDGFYREKDFSDFVRTAPGRLAKLADEKFFAKVSLNRSKGTIEWPGEIDFCPESLRGR